MIQKLHIQLTALCSAITGLVLAILTVICLTISESGIRTQETSAFLTNLNTMYENLEVQTALSHNWIRQMEFHYRFTIRLFDNGIPLFYQQLSDDPVTDALVAQSIQRASDEFHLDPTQSSGQSVGALLRQAEFTIRDPSGSPYDVSAAILPRGKGALGAIVLHPLAPMQSRILHQRIAFVLADLAALLVLSIFFWFFTARMIRPIQENRKKQVQFIAAASHELRSPLTVILSNLAAVRSQLMSCDDAFLDTLDLESRRMSRLIGDLLQLAGADNHTWSVQFAETEPDTLLLQTWENYESMARSKELRFDIELPDESVSPIRCDAERISQLLSILIDNAFSYTPKGGRICLSLATETPAYLSDYLNNRKIQKQSSKGNRSKLSKTGKTPRRSLAPFSQIKISRDSRSRLTSRLNRIRYGSKTSKSSRSLLHSGPAQRQKLYLSVIDNGPGIPDAQKEAVFERFHRLDTARRDKAHFGLGLCIAQEIVSLHHGQLLLTDTPGGGATFTIILSYEA